MLRGGKSLVSCFPNHKSRIQLESNQFIRCWQEFLKYIICERMKHVSIHYTYENRACHNTFLVAQAIVCAHVQNARGRLRLTVDYNENSISHQSCLHLPSFPEEKSTPSLCTSSLLSCFSFSSQLKLPWMMSLAAFCLSDLVHLLQTHSYLDSL